MPAQTITRLLDQLEEIKRPATATDARVLRVLNQLDRRRFTDAESLIRFHETLLFMRAYPQSASSLKKVESILKKFKKRVERLESDGADLEPFRDPEVSGIVGSSLIANFSYPVARWLAQHHPAEVTIDWDGYEDGARLGETLPRFVPLLEEESLVEANVPYLKWVQAARGKKRELQWLINRFESLPVSDFGKAELYDSLKLYLHWKPREFSVTRTGMTLPTRGIFLHDRRLLGRRDVSLTEMLSEPPLPVKKLSATDGKRILDTIRSTSSIRFRELHGFSYGDPSHVYRIDAGRGVDFFFNGVDASHRLPLRTYHSAFMVKNGVPIGYVEGISLFERMEIGLNIYYTFRDGESAWLYARVLQIFRQLLGTTTFSVDPYQIGYENEEGIESGAFWFYRKMGFRPVKPSIAGIVKNEEAKIAARSAYRTSERKLRQMAEGHMLFEMNSESAGRWDKFQVRNLGLAVARRMENRFDGDSEKMRRACVTAVARDLGVDIQKWKAAEQTSFANLALVLSLIPGLSRWSESEKSAVVDIVRAKAGREEAKYLRLLQKHHKLRDEIVRLGSRG